MTPKLIDQIDGPADLKGLSDEQLNQFKEHGQRLYRWYTGHPYLHNVIGVPVLVPC